MFSLYLSPAPQKAFDHRLSPEDHGDMSVRRRSRASSRPSPVEIEVPADPNTFTWPDRSRKKFVTLVALQCLVTPAPITNEHPINLETANRSQKRKLPPKTEREIADHFAFLAAGDGSGAACCIEEVDVSVRFRLAMNEGVSATVLEGLKGVLREVRKVATGGRALLTLPFVWPYSPGPSAMILLPTDDGAAIELQDIPVLTA